MRLPYGTRPPFCRDMEQGALVSALLLVLVGSAAAYSAPGQSPPAPTTLHSTSTLVLVPALVQTPSKDTVYLLTARDFELTDNGVPQTVTLEPDADASRPLSLVVVLQTGGAAAPLLARYARLDAMLEGIVGGPPNQVAVVNFDSAREYDSPFTSDVAEWSAAVTHPESGDGGAAIFDALAYALKLLSTQPPDTRRAILLVSQQHDDRSRTSNVKDIIRAVGETNTAVYSLTFSVEKKIVKNAFAEYTRRDKPPAMAGPIDGGGAFDLLAPIELGYGATRKNFAAQVAGLSGGEPFSFSNPVQFDRALNSLANHIHNGYTLSFRPTSNAPGLHHLQLRIRNHPEFLIDSRTSYWVADSQAPEYGKASK